MQTEQLDNYFDLKKLSDYSSYSISSLQKFIKKGLPYYQPEPTGKILVRQSEFDKWINHFRSIEKIKLESVVDSIIKSVI